MLMAMGKTRVWMGTYSQVPVSQSMDVGGLVPGWSQVSAYYVAVPGLPMELALPLQAVAVRAATGESQQFPTWKDLGLVILAHSFTRTEPKAQGGPAQSHPANQQYGKGA